ncbi:MAG TPA: hypothetical protein PLL69_06100 [Gemmatimonadales bacterium]|nr:hypothetical protein [Gemmatimonadales bacterium]
MRPDHRLVLAALLVGACRAKAPTPAEPPPVATSSPLTVSGPDSLLGLLRLGGPPADGSGLLPGPMQLRAAPDDSADVLVTITRWQDLVAEEISYEEPAVAVFRAAVPWYLVAASDSVFGWYHAPEDATMVGVAELLPERLAYLTAAWDGTIHREPVAGSPIVGITVDRLHGEASIEVLETRMVEGGLWVRVAIHESSPCEGTVSPETIATGWVPAWSRGKLNVWYYSRGC